MKLLIKKSNKFNLVATVMTNNPEPFEGFTEIIDARDMFISKKNRITVLISTLNKPYTEVYGVKKDSRTRLRSLLKLAIGTGITIATRQKNQPLLVVMKNYKKILSKTNTHDLPEMAGRVYDELKLYQTIAASSGLTAVKLTELKDLTSGFRDLIEGTDYEISTRQVTRKELRALITDCTRMLKDEIDPFVAHCQESFPEFYNAYTTASGKKKYSRKKSKSKTELANIAGTVTDSVTQKPVAGAIITLDTETVVETDEDGYYEIDEVSAGICNVGCHAPGYIVAESVKADPKSGESLVIDFVLVPVPVSTPG